MNLAVIAVGSNINPVKNVQGALARIAARHRILARSRLRRTEPIGPKDQPDFLNGALLVETQMDRRALRGWLRHVEADLGRVRAAEKSGPRTIDLDIVVWNGRIVHEDVRERDFLRCAVAQVCPDLEIGGPRAQPGAQ